MPSFPTSGSAALQGLTNKGPEREWMTVIDILPPEQRSVRVRVAHRAAGNVADASFVTIPRTVRRSASTRNQQRRSLRQMGFRSLRDWFDLAGAGMAAAERRLMRLSADFFAAVVAVIFIAVFGLAGGFSLFLEDAAPAQAPGLDLTHVNLTSQDADGMGALLITGIIKNNGDQRLEVPAVHADLVTEGATVASAVIQPPVATMEGGHSHGFSARIRHPGGKMPELRLSFASPDASAP